MNILVDSREKGRKSRAIAYYNNKGHYADVETLDVGDYVFSDQVVYEYKEIGDFMSSILNDSLFNEATNQSLVYKYHYVIIVGDVMNYLSDNWFRVRGRYGNDYHKYLVTNLRRYTGALRRLRTFTTPIECKSEENAFHEMLLQSIKCLDGKSKYYSNVVRRVPGQDPVDVLLTSQRNISTKKANRIKEQCNIGNVIDLMNLTVNDFMNVDGMGEKTSNGLYDFLHQGDAE